MANWCNDRKCDFIISTGDNIYNHGVKSSKSKLFAKTWLNKYNHPSLAHLKWYLTVGSHDQDGCVKCQIKYKVGKEKRWPGFLFQDVRTGECNLFFKELSL